MSATKTLFILCLFFGIPSFGQNQSSGSPDEAKIIALERMWNQAQLTRDSNALKGLVSDRFVSTEWDGEFSTRVQFLAEIADPQFVPSVMSLQDVKVEFYGDTAIVIGIYHAQGKYHGKPYDHVGRFTDTWVRDNSAWRCVASHTSLLPKQ
jgi:ketosteroid isomerase-like protein